MISSSLMKPYPTTPHIIPAIKADYAVVLIAKAALLKFSLVF
jgi:hypothetical protein